MNYTPSHSHNPTSLPVALPLTQVTNLAYLVSVEQSSTQREQVPLLEHQNSQPSGFNMNQTAQTQQNIVRQTKYRDTHAQLGNKTSGQGVLLTVTKQNPDNQVNSYSEWTIGHTAK